MNSNTLIVIAGPTAVGKTASAIQLAQQLGCDIISADSRQFFKEISIGTAKPTQSEMGGIPHHFINNKSITETYTAGQFEKDVLNKLQGLFSQNPYAILVGGSGLYINAVCKGIDDIPKASTEIRQQLNQEAKKNLEELILELKQKDPTTFHKIDTQNPVRVVRALEVIRSTGKPYSSFLNQLPKKRPFIIKSLCLDMKRERLYNRINQRVDKMVEQGLIEEAKSMLPFREHNALKTVGYKELFQYFDGKISLELAVKLIKQHTRNYAKRQLTWFRKNESYTWVEINSSNKQLQLKKYL